MSYVILDLEWNAAFYKKEQRYINEIIEFGAVKVDDELNITDTFSTLVMPKIGKRLCSKVKELTGLSLDELKQGVTFAQAVESFTEFASNSVIMTWGTSDIHALIENFHCFFGDRHITFLHKYCDIQEYCEKSMGLYDKSAQMGLSVCAEKLGVEFCEDDQHRAVADAVLSLKCIKELIDRNPLEPYIQDADCERFYDKMTFKTHYISDLNDPEIDKTQLRFYCESCGRRAARVTKWKRRNRSFTADFQCRGCGNRFGARVSFKKTFDEIKALRKIIPKEQPKAEAAEQTSEQAHEAVGEKHEN